MTADDFAGVTVTRVLVSSFLCARATLAATVSKRLGLGLFIPRYRSGKCSDDSRRDDTIPATIFLSFVRHPMNPNDMRGHDRLEAVVR